MSETVPNTNDAAIELLRDSARQHDIELDTLRRRMEIITALRDFALETIEKLGRKPKAARTRPRVVEGGGNKPEEETVPVTPPATPPVVIPPAGWAGFGAGAGAA